MASYYSGQGPRSSRWSETGSRATSPPPPYSKDPLSPEPPPYQGLGLPRVTRVNEQTPLLGRYERVSYSREAYTAETWEGSRYQLSQRGRRRWFCPDLKQLGMVLCSVLLSVGVIFLMSALVWFLVWCFKREETLGLWPNPPPLPRYSVAIIGAGPAGISAAHYLRSLPRLRNVDFDITMFEAAPSIGGKLAFFDSEDSRVFPYNDSTLDPISAEDITGPALMWSNSLFTQSSEEILWEEVEFFDLPSQVVGHYSVDRRWWVVQTTRPYGETSTGELFELILRYGSSVWDGGRMLGEANIRELIRYAPLSPDVPKILSSMDLTGLAQEWAADTLGARHLSEWYVDDIIAPQVERGSNIRIAKMNGLSMIMGAVQGDSAYKHAGGDFVERIGRIARALRGVDVRTNSKVTGMKRSRIDENKEAWLIQNEGFGHAEIEAFDQVIIAAPGLEQQRLVDNFVQGNATADDGDGDDDNDVEIEEVVEYDPVHVTFFTTSEPLQRPLPSADDAWVPPQVLYLDSARGIHEVTYVREVVRHGDDGSRSVEHLYRYTTEEDVQDLLSANPAVTWVYHRRLDYAYPLTYPRTRYPSFRLDDGLWTTGAIHSIGSTIDLSWLAGKIVAREIVNKMK